MRSTPGSAGVTEAARHPTHPGLVLGIARFFYDPRGSMRGVLDSHPSEARILAYGIIAASLLLVGRVVTLVAAGNAQGGDLLARAMEQSVSMLFFVPLLYYGLAAIGTVIARTFGGDGRWTDGRAAFFWAALVSAPVMVCASLASVIASRADQSLIVLVGQIGPVFFAWALAQCFAETFGFSRPSRVLAVIVVPIILVLILALLLKS